MRVRVSNMGIWFFMTPVRHWDIMYPVRGAENTSTQQVVLVGNP